MLCKSTVPDRLGASVLIPRHGQQGGTATISRGVGDPVRAARHGRRVDLAEGRTNPERDERQCDGSGRPNARAPAP